MKRLLVLIGIPFLFSTASAETPLQNVAIRVSSGFDQFANCAASVALASARIHDELKVLSSVEVMTAGPGPHLLAKLKFLAKSPTGALSKYELTFRSVDEQTGFQLIKGANGEIYPYTSAMESDAMLVAQPKGLVFGMFDVSGCRVN